ncbi:MAG: hypothetical protein LBE12_17020, partial [Planctomycetaceae bacterium]|nr:hypothetical protein [Planctomycetaceae bacterium]
IGLCNTENEITVTPTTHSIALFKNGVTVVQQEIAVPAPGLYCWNEVPKVIHGTFFIEIDLFWELQLKPGEKKTITVSGTRWFRY